MVAMNKSIVVAYVALLLDEEEQTRKKDEHALFGQGRGCYAEKLTVISIQYFKPIFTKAPFGEFDWKNGKFLVGKN